MPLQSGKSSAAFSANVRELVKANASKSAGKKRPMRQILAIAYAQKRKSK